MLESVIRPFQLINGANKIPIVADAPAATVSISSAIIDPGNGGSGYAVDDTIILSGGAGVPGVLRVSGVDGGAITTLTIDSAGRYTIFPVSNSFLLDPITLEPTTTPSSQVTQRSTSGSGAGAVFTLVSSGTDQSKPVTWGGVGKLPSPVNPTVGAKIETHDYTELGRKTINVKIVDDAGSGSFITQQRTKSMTFSRKKDEATNEFATTSFTIGAQIDATLAAEANSLTNGFEKAFDTRVGQSKHRFTFKPKATP